jgi:hypothetical protein
LAALDGLDIGDQRMKMPTSMGLSDDLLVQPALVIFNREEQDNSLIGAELQRAGGPRDTGQEALYSSMATAATAGAETASLNAPKQSTLLLPGGKGNACKSRLPSATGGANLSASPRRRPNARHATPLPARSTLTAGPCSISLHPTVGRSFSRA